MDLDHLWDGLFSPASGNDLPVGINDIENLSAHMTTVEIDIEGQRDNELEYILLWFGLWGTDLSPTTNNRILELLDTT